MRIHRLIPAVVALGLLGTNVAAEEPSPVVMVVAHPVADYEVWRAKYDELLPVREAAGMTRAQILHAPDDPNMIILIHEFETLEGVETLMNSPEVKLAMQEAGVLAKPVFTVGVNAD